MSQPEQFCALRKRIRLDHGEFEDIPMANIETVKQVRMHIRLDTLSKQKLERTAAYAKAKKT